MNETEQATTPGPVPTKMQMTPRKWLIVAAVVLVAFAGLRSVFSPENIVERAIESQTGGDVDLDLDGEGSMTFEGKDGEKFSVTAGDAAKLPSDWPDSVPIMDDATITYAGSMGGGDGTTGLTAVYTVSESKADVVEFYKSELAAEGWTIAGVMDFGDSGMVTATRNESETVGVTVATENGDTTVTVSVGLK